MFVIKFGKLTLGMILIFLLLPAQSGKAKLVPMPVSTPVSSPGDIGWQGGFSVNGTDKYAWTIAVDGGKVYLGGDFTTAGDVIANYVVQWDGSGWTPLGSGMNGTVRSLAVDGRGHLYAVGLFTQAGGQPANHVARWNGQNWEALGSGVNGYVMSIVVDGSGNVYVGGKFDNAGGVSANGVAKWDGSGWSSPGNGELSGIDLSIVYSLTIDRYGFLYAGGFFSQIGGDPANGIARWDGATWEALGDGIKDSLYSNAVVYALAADNRGNVYAGGWFDTAGGIPASNLAKWNGEAWSEVGGGIQFGVAVKAVVTSIIADGGMVYVGGNFNAADGAPMGSIASWNGSTWGNMQGGVWQDKISQASISNMAIDRDGRIFTIGAFSLAGGICASGIAVWDDGNWSSLGVDTSVDGSITAMISDQHGGYYAGGFFTCAGGLIVNHIAHWDGTIWSGLGSGLSNGNDPVIITTLALDQNEDLYATGAFSTAGDISAQIIARWDGEEWHDMGEGLIGYPQAITIDGQNNVYVGGQFFSSWNYPYEYYHLFKWDGNQWENIGVGFDGPVVSLAIDSQGRLIAGGNFNMAGEVTAHGLARWNGIEWEALTQDYLNTAALLIDGDTVYGLSSRVWKLQDDKFEFIELPISPPPDKPYVQTLALDQKGRLVIGGQFAKAGQVVVNNIARWNGLNWEALGSGFGDGGVTSIVVDDNGRLIVGGGFSQVGCKASFNLAIWKDPNYAWLPFISR